jgi:GTPase SAR1 family protein
MTEPASTAAVAKLSVSFIERVASPGIVYVKSVFRGKEVLVIGQPRSGKTTFIEYLRHGLFEDEKDTEKTLLPEQTPRFDVKLGRQSSLELTIKRVVDVPGQIGAAQHAQLAYERNPHAIVIFMDLTAPLKGAEDRSSAAWLTEFSKRYEALWRAGNRKKHRIKCIIIVLNKLDKSTARKVESTKKEFQKIIKAELHDGLGKMQSNASILPCVMVSNPEEEKFVTMVITHLAKSLAK